MVGDLNRHKHWDNASNTRGIVVNKIATEMNVKISEPHEHPCMAKGPL